ncbi:MAG: prenyltransferase/squalene oxidase repeat-containing protein [Planctomycetota bacterium]
MRTLSSLLLVAFAFTPLTPVHAAPLAAQAKPPSKEINLGSDIDGAIRWLRSVQDPKDGSYGGSVETTAWVLRVMVESPRRYRRVDGPFVERALRYVLSRQQTDGSIHDAGATLEQISEQTRVASAALALHADESTKPAVAKAVTFIAKGKGDTDGWRDAPLPEAKDALHAQVTALLAKRGADGTWDGPRGKVQETARAAATLCRAYSQLKPPDAPPAAAARPLAKMEPADRAKALAAQERGAQYLASKATDGKFGPQGKPDAGTTSMAIGALLATPEPRPKAVQDVIEAGLKWLASLQKSDGGIHDGKLANYTTSASIMALARAKRAEFEPVIEKARGFLVSLQADEGEGYSEDQLYYGGIGYGSSERPDLSNLQMALEALTDSGLPQDHAAFQRALKFLERCQNRSESNDVQTQDAGKTVVSGDDGGSAYAPGMSNAGFVELADGTKVPRSYGSMSYALLKAYIFVGLPKDDPRMKAVWEWLRKNYTLDVNPGFESSADPAAAYQGLFYYFHTMAKALDLYGEEQIVDAQNVSHAWRKELCGRMVAMQSKIDGSWVNENSPRWWEGNPVLATSYALLVLDEALPSN